MRIGKFLTAVAVTSLVTAPVLAAPVNPASSLSVSGVKSVSAVHSSSDLRGRGRRGGGAVIIGLLAAAAIIAAIIIAVRNNNNNVPVSR